MAATSARAARLRAAAVRARECAVGVGRSRFTGVRWDAPSQAWVAEVEQSTGLALVGHFSDEVDAARAHDYFVVEHNVDRYLNFPSDAAAAQHETTRSRYNGVAWSKTRRQWRAEVAVRGALRRIGYFDEETEGEFSFMYRYI